MFLESFANPSNSDKKVTAHFSIVSFTGVRCNGQSF